MNESGREVRLLVGHSFGGAAVIAAAHEVDSVRAVASIGAPYEPGHVEHNYDALVERILADGEAPFLIGGKALTLRRHFIEDVRAADLREQIRTLHRALLVMHSPTDNTVGHRERQRDLPGRAAPAQLRVAGGRRPPADRPQPGQAGGPDHQRLGGPLPLRRLIAGLAPEPRPRRGRSSLAGPTTCALTDGHVSRHRARRTALTGGDGAGGRGGRHGTAAAGRPRGAGPAVRPRPVAPAAAGGPVATGRLVAHRARSGRPARRPPARPALAPGLGAPPGRSAGAGCPVTTPACRRRRSPWR